MRRIQRTAATRVIAALIAALALVASTPQPAFAARDNIWKIWATEVKNRQAWEVPFAVVFSLPAIIITTPFWLGNVALDKLKGED